MSLIFTRLNTFVDEFRRCTLVATRSRSLRLDGRVIYSCGGELLSRSISITPSGSSDSEASRLSPFPGGNAFARSLAMTLTASGLSSDASHRRIAAPRKNVSTSVDSSSPIT